MTSFVSHPTEYEGLIEISHSLQKPKHSKTIDLKDVDHVIIDPHGSLGVPPVKGLEEFLSHFDYEKLRQYFAVERDLGMSEFRDQLVRIIPNTLAINFTVNRGIIDPNRTPAAAMRNIVSKSPKKVQKELMDRHIRSLKAVDQVLAKLKPGVKVTLAHSTEPFNNAENVSNLDLFDPANFKKFLDVRTNVGKGHGTVIPVCFITGKGDKPSRDDLRFRKDLQAYLKTQAITYVNDDPYFTRQGKHMTSHYMRAYPGDVNTIDWPRDMLATGEIADGTFSLTGSVADPKKVEKVAELFAESLKRCLKNG